jgi:hypothetical protein
MVSMFYTSKMSDQEFLDFVRLHTVSGSCGTHGAEKAAANDQSAFTKSMLSQASTVFGADSGVFNSMKNAYSQLLAAGPSQQGFSAAQQSAMNASAITNGANQTRFAEARLGGQQAGAGGGNAPNASGIGAGDRAGVAEKFGEATANSLNEIQQKNYEQGNINWRTAGEELGKAPGVFGNLSGVDASAQTGLDKNMSNATAADAASNWWVKPVEAVAGDALNAASGGLTGFATQFGKNAANNTNGRSGSGPNSNPPLDQLEV